MLSRILKKLEPSLIRIYHRISDPPPPNLIGDRQIEHSWIAANLPSGPGVGLDFGCGQSSLALVAAERGFRVTAIDLVDVSWPYEHPRISFAKKDIFDLAIQPSTLDLIINCSAIEHVGLTRYGDREDPDGDLKAMQVMRELLKPDGMMFLTIPVGEDAVFAPLHRIYGNKKLPKLLEGYNVLKKAYWIKDEQNRWTEAKEEEALGQEPSRTCYGLGCFVLKRS